MKKAIVLISVVALIATLAGCADKSAQLVGDWEIVSGTARFGRYLRFEKNGAMYCTPHVGKNDIFVNIDEEFRRMSEYCGISYCEKKKETVELTITIFGEKFVTEVAYTVDGDVLIFDGDTYKRIA